MNVGLWVSSIPPPVLFLLKHCKNFTRFTSSCLVSLFKSQGSFFYVPCLFLPPPPAELPTCCKRSTIVWKINPNLCSSFQSAAESLFRLVLVSGDGGFWTRPVTVHRHTGGLKGKYIFPRCVCAFVCVLASLGMLLFHIICTMVWLFWWINMETFILPTFKV